MPNEAFQAFTPFEGVPTCSAEEAAHDLELTTAYYRTLDRKLIAELYRRLPSSSAGGQEFCWGRFPAGYSVILTVSDSHGDGKRWVHVSLAYPNRVPSYDELAEVKRIFVGLKRQAIMVLPREEKHINIHPYCLHLYCCLDGDGLPDFGREGSI